MRSPGMLSMLLAFSLSCVGGLHSTWLQWLLFKLLGLSGWEVWNGCMMCIRTLHDKFLLLMPTLYSSILLLLYSINHWHHNDNQ